MRAWLAGMGWCVGAVAWAAPPPLALSLQGSTQSPTTMSVDNEATFQVTGLAPGAPVWLVVSDGQVGPGPCYPFLGGTCMPMTQGTRYAVVGSASADGAGVATLVRPVAAGVPLLDWAFAAFSPTGGAAAVSNVLEVRTTDTCPVDDLEGGVWPGEPVDPAGVGVFNLHHVCGGAGDFFEVLVPAGDRLQAYAGVYGVAPGTALQIVHPSGTASAAVGPGGRRMAQRWVNSTGADVTVTVGVSTPSAHVVYDLRWYTESDEDLLDCDQDVFEPNNGLAYAAPVEAGLYGGTYLCGDGNGAAVDDDWYRVDVLAGEELLASAYPEDWGNDVGVAIHGPDGDLLSALEAPGGAGVVYLPAVDGPLFVHVYMVSQDDDTFTGGTQYELEIYLTSPTP